MIEDLDRVVSREATRTVYSYYYPETRAIVNEVVRDFPHDVYMRSIPNVNKDILPLVNDKILQNEEFKNGLDDYHTAAVNAYRAAAKNIVFGLDDFQNSYFTNGASEAIFHVIANLAARAIKPILYVFRGEYEGYYEYAKELNLKVVCVDDVDEVKDYGVFIISQPSARNGNLISEAVIKAAQKNTEVILDITYIGLIDPRASIVVNYPNVSTVIVSLSKPYGLYYYRSGFLFSRQPVNTLFGNKWFKNILTITITERMLKTYGLGYFYSKYSPIQSEAIAHYEDVYDCSLKPSDVMLLAHAPSNLKQAGIKTYEREYYYRLCLTPYFMYRERMGL